jgi:hypothetical protein
MNGPHASAAGEDTKARFKRDSVHTRLYRGACIFHNRVDHPGGSGPARSDLCYK